MIIFLCKPLSNQIKLSNEHTDFIWIDLDKANTINHIAYHDLVDIYKKHFLKI